MRTRFLVLVAIAVAGLTPGRADAHDLQLKVQVHPDKLRIVAGFDDETPAEDATVTIVAANGSMVAGGTTDERGVCELPLPGRGKYTARVASIGHTDAVEFEVAEPDGIALFHGGRLDRTLGLTIGAGGLLAVSAGYWWRQKSQVASRKVASQKH